MWGAIDVRFILEARGMSQDEKLLFLAARLYCAERETDGVFSRAQLVAIADDAEVTSDPTEIAAACVKRGLWAVTSGGWRDVRFLDDNPSHQAREANRQKAKDWRRRQKSNGSEQASRTGTQTGSRTGTRSLSQDRTGQDNRAQHISPDLNNTKTSGKRVDS